MQQFRKHLIPLGNGFADRLAVYIKIIEKTGKVAFCITAGGAALDMGKHTLQSFVQIFILVGAGKNITEQFGRQDKEAFFLYQSLAGSLRLCIGHFCIVKIHVSCGVLTGIYVSGEILRNIAIKHGAENIRLEIPLGHMTGVDKVSRNLIYGAE